MDNWVKEDMPIESGMDALAGRAQNKVGIYYYDIRW